MILPDVNLLVLAHRAELPGHAEAHAWLASVLDGAPAFGVSELVLSGVLRVATNPRVFVDPSPLEEAVAFVELLVAQPHCARLRPGPRHLALFLALCDSAAVRGNLVADAYHAALAIEHGCEWLTLDRDFARFPELTWRNPLRS